MSSNPKENTNTDWNKFIDEVLKPQGLSNDLNGDTELLKRFFSLRLARAKGDQTAQQKILQWNGEIEGRNPDFFPRTDLILNAITRYTEIKSIRPGMRTRGGGIR